MSGNLFKRLTGGITDEAKVAISTLDGSRILYRDLLERSARYAGAFATLGVGPGDRVAVQVEKSPEVILLYLGCLRAGAVYLPLNTDYTETEISYFLEDAEPALAVCRSGSRTSIARAGAPVRGLTVATLDADGSGSLADAAASGAATFVDVDCEDGDLAAILYTSGTTGRSKGAMLTHRNLASNAEALAAAWHFTDEDVLLHALPIYHTHGLFVATNVTLLAGASMVLLPHFSVDDIFDAMPEASVMMGVPTFYSRLLGSSRLNRDSTDDMRLFISGSAPLSPDVHRRFAERTGHAVLEGYGMTETNMNTSNPYDGERRPGTVGFPLPGVEIRIADLETSKPVAPGEVGVIEIRGPNVFEGYWRMPEKTAGAFRDDGYFISGDLGRLDEAGYVQIVGRDKDLIISGGLNVYPAEIEVALDALDGIAESAVVGLPHTDFGEGVTAIVVAVGDGVDDAAEEKVLKALASTLAGYKIPKRVIAVDTLPRNAMGKVQKNVLRQTYADLYSE